MAAHGNRNGTDTGSGSYEPDAIAVIGMACRFPLDAENAEKLWEMLLHGRSAVTDFPSHKFNFEAHYHPDPAHGGTVCVPVRSTAIGGRC